MTVITMVAAPAIRPYGADRLGRGAPDEVADEADERHPHRAARSIPGEETPPTHVRQPGDSLRPSNRSTATKRPMKTVFPPCRAKNRSPRGR